MLRFQRLKNIFLLLNNCKDRYDSEYKNLQTDVTMMYIASSGYSSTKEQMIVVTGMVMRGSSIVGIIDWKTVILGEEHHGAERARLE